MKFSEVILKLKEFYDTDDLEELSQNIGIRIEDLKTAFLNKDYETINIFFQKNKNSLLPILRKSGKIDNEKRNNELKYRLRKFTASARYLSNAIADLKELYNSDDLEFIANKISISLERLNELIALKDFEAFMEDIYLKYEDRKEAVEYILLKAELRLKLQRRNIYIPEDIEDKYSYFNNILVDLGKPKSDPEKHKAVFKRKVYNGGLRKVSKNDK